MRFKKLLIYSSALALLGACKTAKSPVAEQVNTVEEITDDSYRKVIKNKELYTTTTETVAIDSATVSRDTLHIYTAKLQACDAENFKLIWDGKEVLSVPAKASLKVLLINDPACREAHRFHLTYNIAGVHPKKNTLSVVTDTMLLQLPRVKQPVKYAY